ALLEQRLKCPQRTQSRRVINTRGVPQKTRLPRTIVIALATKDPSRNPNCLSAAREIPNFPQNYPLHFSSFRHLLGEFPVSEQRSHRICHVHSPVFRFFGSSPTPSLKNPNRRTRRKATSRCLRVQP